jgi:hypothetical protein
MPVSIYVRDEFTEIQKAREMLSFIYLFIIFLTTLLLKEIV